LKHDSDDEETNASDTPPLLFELPPRLAALLSGTKPTPPTLSPTKLASLAAVAPINKAGDDVKPPGRRRKATKVSLDSHPVSPPKTPPIPAASSLILELQRDASIQEDEHLGGSAMPSLIPEPEKDDPLLEETGPLLFDLPALLNTFLSKNSPLETDSSVPATANQGKRNRRRKAVHVSKSADDDSMSQSEEQQDVAALSERNQAARSVDMLFAPPSQEKVASTSQSPVYLAASPLLTSLSMPPVHQANTPLPAISRLMSPASSTEASSAPAVAAANL
jgi:hypothetical protein